MTQKVDVRAVHALDELRVALVRFRTEIEASLREMEAAIHRVEQYLGEREAHWKRQVIRREAEHKKALAALAACRSQAYRDPKTGRTYVPPCTQEQEWVMRTRVELERATAALRTVREWRKVVERTVEEYRRQARRLAAHLEENVPKATARLERHAATLRAYTGLAPAPATFTTTPPVQAVADTVATGALLAALGVGVAGIAVLTWLARDLRQALGDAGEELSARLLREEFNLQEVAFDPPKHGFDRVFTAAGAPIIILESKVHHKGEFHPGQTQAGEQGSPEWIAAHAEKMADPASAEWSPTNERIAAVIREIGPENVPVVAVVIESETGRASVYYRTAGTEEWQALREGVSLAEALTEAHQRSGHAASPGDVERERGPETLEGGLGSVEGRG